jgi:hypothetical protein
MIRALGCALAVLVACSHRDEDAKPTPTSVAPASPDRVAAWREDVRALATELPRRHKHAFFHVAEADWRRSVDDLDRRLPQLDDAHTVAELARLVAVIGDAHTTLDALGRSGVYPLSLVWFDDGIFVTGAADDDRWAIGRRVVGIGRHTIDDAIAAIAPLVAHDNAAGLHGQLPAFLLDPAMLAGIDLAAADHAQFQLAATDGSIRELDVKPALWAPSIAPPRTLPLHLQGPATNYWNKYVAADRLIYFAYNACADDPRVGPFSTFAASTLAFVDQQPVDRFVIDLRRNSGGNSEIINPLIDGLANRPARAGRVFVIIGMHTFSSAMLNAMTLKRRLHATLVGGPTAGTPSGYGEVQTFALPRSGLVVQYSTKLFSNPDFPGDAVEPDVPVKVVADDWFSGRDPALAAILAAPLPLAPPSPLTGAKRAE